MARVEHVLEGLTETPERGFYPLVLSALGIREYRQVFFKPYRMIYQVMGRHVVVMLISGGRRDMPSLLQRRLLGG